MRQYNHFIMIKRNNSILHLIPQQKKKKRINIKPSQN